MSSKTTDCFLLQYQPVVKDRAMPLEGFRVFYKPYTLLGEESGEYRSVTVSGTRSRQALLAGLLPRTMYSVRMASFNADGLGPYSNVVAMATVGKTDCRVVIV